MGGIYKYTEIFIHSDIRFIVKQEIFTGGKKKNWLGL